MPAADHSQGYPVTEKHQPVLTQVTPPPRAPGHPPGRRGAQGGGTVIGFQRTLR